MELKKKYLRNSLYNVIGWGVPAILGLVTTPYFVHRLGYDAYGLLTLITLVLGYFAFLDLGLFDALLKYVSHYHADGAFDRLNGALNSTLFFFIVIGGIGAACILACTRYFVFTAFQIPAALHPLAVSCFSLSAVLFFLTLMLGALSKIPEALQRFEISNRITAGVSVAATLGNVLLLYLGYGVLQILTVNILSAASGILCVVLAAKRLIPRVRIDPTFALRDFRPMFHFGSYTIFSRFSSLVTSSLNQLCIGAVVGVAGLTLFNVPFILASAIQMFMYRLAFAIFPVSSELLARNDMTALHQVYQKVSKYLFLISSVLFVPLIAYRKSILLYWVGVDFAVNGEQVMAMICLALYFISLTMVPGLVALGLGKPNYNAALSSLTAGINILLVYPLTKFWGIRGAAASLLLSSMTFPFAIWIITRNVVKLRPKQYFKYVFDRDPIIIVLALILFSALGKAVTGFWTFLGAMTFSYGILALYFYKIGLKDDDRTFLAGSFLRIKGSG